MGFSHHPVAALARRQHGNVSLDQVRALGMSATQVKGLVSGGVLIRRHRGVYAVGHVPTSRESRWAAGVLALGDDALLSHRCAGALYGISPAGSRVEVVIPRASGCPSRSGVLVHRADIPPHHRARRQGIPVTSLIRTLLDLAAILPLHLLALAFEEAQLHHGLKPERLAAEVCTRAGYRGNIKLTTILEGAVDPDAVRSILELRFLQLCRANGIPRPLVNRRLGKWTPDFLWPDPGLVVETDGAAFHRTTAKRRRDAEKDAFFTAQGYSVIRLGWRDVTEEPNGTALRVSAALSAAPG